MRLSAFDFAAEVERRIEALTDEQFHLRKGEGKVLQEEWYPIGRLGLHLKQPGLDVVVEAFDDSDVADGRIYETGFRNRNFDVQVTYDYDHDRRLRRELMLNQGFTPESGPISQVRRTKAIKATMMAVDDDHNAKQLAVALADRFEMKSAKEYPPDTCLILAFEDIKLRGRGQWSMLWSSLDELVSLGGSRFKAVYLINCATNELQQAA